MDTLMNSLPPEVGNILMGDITVVEIISMFAIGSFMAVEVALSTLNQFKRYRGLYFWSMQIAAWGIVVHGITAQVRYISKASNISMAIPFVLGWYCMVQGQAVVLYSRLHLVVSDICHIRWVLWMILANFFILSVPMTALFLCQNLGNNPKCATPAAIFDRVQVPGFAIQDMVISGIYIREALRALKPIFAMKGRAGRSVIYQLIIINVIVVGLNTTLVVTEFKMHFITVSYKTVVYSVELKLEFSILSKLRELTRTYPCVCHPGNVSPRVSSDINIFDLLARAVPARRVWKWI
ncbi:hypothetical protein N7467_003557 [Penicillium canescens]|nr:hypothetical protein N7467_003557 [Penicillium canescens]